MIDGEFFICEHPMHMEYTHCFQIKVLGPHDPEVSRLIADDEQYNHLKVEDSPTSEKTPVLEESPIHEKEKL